MPHNCTGYQFAIFYVLWLFVVLCCGAASFRFSGRHISGCRVVIRYYHTRAACFGFDQARHISPKTCTEITKTPVMHTCCIQEHNLRLKVSSKFLNKRGYLNVRGRFAWIPCMWAENCPVKLCLRESDVGFARQS